MLWIDLVKRALQAGSASFVGSAGNDRPATPRRSLAFEPLEPRLTMAAAGLVAVGTQPTGTLSGKIVYTSPGHGFEFEGGATNGGWLTDRPDYNEIVEDLGNQDQFTFYVDYLFRAGATVVPMRPVGRQINQAVVDNDLASVTYTGSWSDSAGARHFDEDYGATPDSVRYRFASTSANETATATYTPNIPAAGFYPVYTWVAPGTNRASQLYKVNHTGGQTQVRVDHRMVGHGWVYLGTYHFNSGSSPTAGSVVISNQSTSGTVVIADAIRFGNGMGDLPWGSGGIGTGSVSGDPREDESSYMWLYRGIGLGITPSDVIGSGNVSAPSDMAEYMNQDSNPFGTSLYIGFHSNGTTGDPNTATARGAVGLIEADIPDRTPHQVDLATYTGRQINLDMQALNGVFENNWSTRTTHTFTEDFGEINLGTGAEMDATIIEVGFHDTTADAVLLRDPKARDQLARSVYEATLEYFVNWGNDPKPANVTLPSSPTGVRAVSNAAGEVTVSWTAGQSSSGGYNGVHGSPATGFRVYASSDGYGFDGGTLVAGGGATSATLSGFDPALPYYFKVVAVNAGGESKASEVVTALPSGGAKQVLIVNGFDRHDRFNNFRYSYYSPAGNFVDRVWSRYNNSFDYVVQVHTAIHAAAPGVHVASTSNEAVISGAVNLTDYDTVIWILGEESTSNETFNASEQTKVEQFIAGGGNLFLSGAEIGWDLDRPDGASSTNPTAADRTFYENTLMANYTSDDAGSYTATPVAAGIFAGLANVGFSNGSAFSNLDGQMYNVDTPDVIAAQSGAQLALNYVGGTGGGAAIQVAGTGGRGNVVMFGFPFETITSAAGRTNIIDRVFDFFGLSAIVPDNADFNDDNIVDAADYVTWRKNENTSVPPGTLGDANHDGQANDADYQIWRAQFGTSPGSGAQVTSATAASTSATTASVTDSAANHESRDESLAVSAGALAATEMQPLFRRTAGAIDRVPGMLVEADHRNLERALLSLLATRGHDAIRPGDPLEYASQDLSDEVEIIDDALATGARQTPLPGLIRSR